MMKKYSSIWSIHQDKLEQIKIIIKDITFSVSGILFCFVACSPNEAVREKTTEPHGFVRVGDLKIKAPWVRASIIPNRPTAAYLTIVNAGPSPDRLIGVESPAAAKSDVRKSKSENGVMRMAPAGVIEIPPGGAVVLAPGGFYIMLTNLSKPLAEGGKITLWLEFERAGKAEVMVPVYKLYQPP